LLLVYAVGLAFQIQIRHLRRVLAAIKAGVDYGLRDERNLH
jgi:hypothetical protein